LRLAYAVDNDVLEAAEPATSSRPETLPSMDKHKVHVVSGRKKHFRHL
jgi:hypothetical protein